MITHHSRSPHWRTGLVAWAAAVRGLSYKWGVTDCASLVREALHVQFGFDVLGRLNKWYGVRSALQVWEPISRNGGMAGLFGKLGAIQLENRHQGARYPMGSVLALQSDPTSHSSIFPALGVVVSPWIVQSNEEQGVCWTVDYDEIQTAWLFEEVIFDG